MSGRAAALCSWLLAGIACGPTPLEQLGASGRRAAIVNGRDVAPGELPAVGALTLTAWPRRGFCTATLITRQTVLTAAHCLVNRPDTPLSVYFGDDVDAPEAGLLVDVARRVAHPEFTGERITGLEPDFDIGVVHLAEPVEGIEPMRLIQPAQVDALMRRGQPVVIAGFGEASPGEVQSFGRKRLAEAHVSKVGDQGFFVWSDVGGNKCQGDSGGPTLVDIDPGPELDWRQIGVAARGTDGCNNGSIDTRVDALLGWIEHQAAPLPCSSGTSTRCAAAPSASLGQLVSASPAQRLRAVTTPPQATEETPAAASCATGSATATAPSWLALLAALLGRRRRLACYIECCRLILGRRPGRARQVAPSRSRASQRATFTSASSAPRRPRTPG